MFTILVIKNLTQFVFKIVSMDTTIRQRNIGHCHKHYSSNDIYKFDNNGLSIMLINGWK